MLLALLQFFYAQFLYLALHLESGSFPRPLTPREEAAAFEALRAGDAAARETIIRHNLRLVAILRPPRRPGRPHQHRHHRPHQGRQHL